MRLSTRLIYPQRVRHNKHIQHLYLNLIHTLIILQPCISFAQSYLVLPYKPNISLIHSILYYKLFAYICKFLYLYNIILADIYA